MATKTSKTTKAKATKESVVVKQTTKTTKTTMHYASALNSVELETQTGKSSASKARKRSDLTLRNGNVLDLSKRLTAAQATTEVVEAMRLRILELEEELSGPPTKRRKTNTNANAEDSFNFERPASALPVPTPTTGSAASMAPAPTAASIKAEEKVKRAHLKKIIDRLKKDLKSDDVKFKAGDSTQTIKSDFVMAKSEFDSVFGGKGRLIQPTPTNKPNSTVTVMFFYGEHEVADLFGSELKALQGNKWIPRSIFEPKARKIGTVDVDITKIDVNYASASMKLTLKFEVVDPDDNFMGYYF